MASTSDQPVSAPAPAREPELDTRCVVIVGHCYEPGYLGGRPGTIKGTCPGHLKHLNTLAALTGYKLDNLRRADRRDLSMAGDSMKDLQELGKEIPADGYGHPDVVAIKGAIRCFIKHRSALAKRKKQREEAIAVAATAAPSNVQQNEGTDGREAELVADTFDDSDAAAIGENDQPTIETAKKNQSIIPEITVTSPTKSTAAAREMKDLARENPVVGNEPAGPAKAPKIPTTRVDRIKAKVAAVVAKFKRVADIMC